MLCIDRFKTRRSNTPRYWANEYVPQLFQKEVNTQGDQPPIGIVLGAQKDHILVEYATESISNNLFISKYQLYLPDKKLLENELNKLMEL